MCPASRGTQEPQCWSLKGLRTLWLCWDVRIPAWPRAPQRIVLTTHVPGLGPLKWPPCPTGQEQPPEIGELGAGEDGRGSGAVTRPPECGFRHRCPGGGGPGGGVLTRSPAHRPPGSDQGRLRTAVQPAPGRHEGRRPVPLGPQHQHARPARHVWGREGRERGPLSGCVFRPACPAVVSIDPHGRPR